MVFSSLSFLTLFLPLTILLYFAVPRRFRNLLLFLASLIFYAWGEPVYIVLMLFSSVVDYSHGLLMEKFDGRPGVRRALLISSVAINLSLLGFFKYAGLVVSTLNAALSLSIPVPSVALPVGISFYTFQTMSYSIDVYRRNCPAQRDPIAFGCYVTMFPQLIAGPIVRYVDVMREINDRRETFEGFYLGIRRFLVGLAKKLILANGVGMLWDSVSAQPAASLSALSAWLGVLAYAFQIYFDFSGYSDMAIGMGLMMGFEYKENFDHPYAAISVTDFWRRWHISLSSFFREYVYIPMGGNRVCRGRWMFNILTVWMLTGLWHGASWNFVLWGLYYGVLLLLEKTLYGKYLEKIPVLNHAYTLLAVVCGWVFFRFDSLAGIGQMFKALVGGYGFFGLEGNAMNILGRSGLDMLFVLAFVAGVTLAFPWFKKFERDNRRLPTVVRSACSAGLLVLCIILIEIGAYNPFIYFRF